MTSDANKGVSSIEYNYLNLPTKVTVTGANAGTIDYVYDAMGGKLKKVVSGGSVTEYAGNYIYENGMLQFFNHPEGYATPNNTGGYDYVYQYKDHLGNIRLSYTDDPSNPGTPTIIEENNYYPFGGKHKGYNMGGDNALGNDLAQKWKFGGKELDESLGLETYDFGARNFDPWIGRWMNLDPLAEQMRRHSPYNYAFNNPIYWQDPDGMSPCPPGIDCSGMVGAFKRFFGISDGPRTPKKFNKVRLPGVNFTVKGGKKGLVRPEVVKDRTANITTVEVDVIMELTNVYGPETPAGSSALEPDADGVNINTNENSNTDNNTTTTNTNNENSADADTSNNTMVDANMDNDVEVEYKVEGDLKENARYGANNPDYGGTGESVPTNDPEKVKKDSAEFAKTNLFERLRIKRDTIEN